MRHIHIPGKNNHVLVLLHGTGGSASSLFEIGQYIDPEATMIGFQGEGKPEVGRLGLGSGEQQKGQRRNDQYPRARRAG